MHRRPTHVVGIAGPSGSGKTSLARALIERVPERGVLFALDAYYRDQRGVREEVIDVDTPGALDHDLLVAQLRDLATGRAIRQPVYDYATHSRAESVRTLEPASCVVVDGLFTLYWDDVRRLLTTSVFLSLEHEECLRRRIARDTMERERGAQAVVAHYERAVRPMYDLHVHPTRLKADLVLDGREPIDTLAERVLTALRG